ncbi:uncharacterized protein BO66DRAFT_392983 [Aspergillus aculeatinus CBS 121060]|uniref:Uncharacterized protein n=1 Tax=Aspergillus aculeatinus CBS 121060 TaxID=1448322 RepID=A0ACD1H4V6_9EURO|nr:hypothetical protein BO66DRAFT_392983 [Aspergillus aculeatinus CBS 121060]RAH68656.1 hypothetical protein BO66DRAFT_392983 [Aspergillus aculeatinus CBS 121060]
MHRERKATSWPAVGPFLADLGTAIGDCRGLHRPCYALSCKGGFRFGPDQSGYEYLLPFCSSQSPGTRPDARECDKSKVESDPVASI